MRDEKAALGIFILLGVVVGVLAYAMNAAGEEKKPAAPAPPAPTPPPAPAPAPPPPPPEPPAT